MYPCLGYAVGSPSGSNSLLCAPTPNIITSGSPSLTSGPKLTAIRFDLQSGESQLSVSQFDGKLVQCALCDFPSLELVSNLEDRTVYTCCTYFFKNSDIFLSQGL